MRVKRGEHISYPSLTRLLARRPMAPGAIWSFSRWASDNS
jgi:hypothetical protein